MTDDFIQKLMISKQIMDKHKEMPRGQNGVGVPIEVNESKISTPDLYTPEPVNATYNIPQEFMGAQTQPANITKPPVVTEDRIKNSKLPDAIKQLMIKHPIKQPEQYSPSLSNDIIEKAARLMSENKIITQTSSKTNTKPNQNSNSDIKNIIKETLEELLIEHGVLSESQTKTEETFQFRVGKHVFEGKVTKIKKLK